MSVTTIDTTLPANLFAGVDQAGIDMEDCARSFQIELRKRLKAEFPKASVFLRWNPNRGQDMDVLTLPPGEDQPGERVKEIIDGLLAEPTAWVVRG